MNILLVSPAFHEYWRSIGHGFVSLGHSVEYVVYDELSSTAASTINKVWIDVPERLGVDRTRVVSRRASALVARALADTDADVVVVVKGDILDPELWARLRRRGVPVVLWLYDELRRTRYVDGQVNAYTAVATYSPEDYQALARRDIVASLVPLAFDPRLTTPQREPISTDAVFVGARYPNRESLLTEVVRRGVPVRAYGRDWSHRVLDRVRTLDWTRPDVPAGPDVTREVAARLLYDALVALNLHGDQDGFNIRTFETCGVAAVQLVDRADVETLYDPGREVLVFGSADELIESVEKVRRDPRWSGAIRRGGRARTLAEHTFAHRCSKLLELC